MEDDTETEEVTLDKFSISMDFHRSICKMGEQPLLAMSWGHYDVKWNSMDK